MPEDETRWRLIDRRIESTPSKLSSSDVYCYYYRDYVEGGYSASTSNQLVLNLKITAGVLADNPSRSHYKDQALKQCVADYQLFFDGFTVRNTNVVVGIIPIPSSKPKNSPDCNDGMIRVAEQLEQYYPTLKFLDLFEVRHETQPSHLGGTRSIEEIKDLLVLNNASLDRFSVVFLLDDMITTGAHFVACRELLQKKYPDLMIAGLFWAKKKPNPYTYYYYSV
ncbi:MAG: hypothetical protein LBK67_05150 [Coriobacteriales bacterium]|jgi:hypothetical protein|nr:hypothetical protein [Coriobacteriales bacterium]